MSNLLALSAPEPMTATQVADNVSRIRGLVSVNARGQKDYLDSAIARLDGMKEDSLRRESQAYINLGVSGLEELQAKLDAANTEGLWYLSNKALNKMPLIHDIKKTGFISVVAVRKAIEEEFLIYVQKQGYKTFNDLGFELFTKEFQKFEREVLGIKRGSIYGGIRKGSRSGKDTILGVIFKEIKGKRKKDLGARLKISSTSSSQSNSGYEEQIQIEIESQDSKQLKFYPYYGLNSMAPEEAAEIVQNQDLWQSFVTEVSNCAGAFAPYVKSSMLSMGKQAFIDTGSSYGDIVGILGELQAMAFLQYLGTKQIITPRFLGHAVDKNNRKVGVDIMLEGVGFQIKNYHTYGSRAGKDEGFQLSNSYKLSNFLEIVSAAPHIAALAQDLELFYAISAYHIALHEDFHNIRAWIDHVQTDQLPNLYHSAIAELLPIKQISWIDQNLQQQGIATNAFYIVGGERILPVSKILSVYIKFLRQLRDKVQSPKLISMRGGKGGVKYSGTETYENYFNNQEGYFFPGYSSIADNMYIAYNININIDYTLEEVLTKALSV